VTQVVVEVLTMVKPDDEEPLARLLGQLSSDATFDRDRIQAVLDHQATELLVARLDGQIVGMATLVSVPLPTGLRGHVEDVVSTSRYAAGASLDSFWRR